MGCSPVSADESGGAMGMGRKRQEDAMVTVKIEVPDDAFSALRRSPTEFAEEMRLAAVIQWFHEGRLSQGMAAEIAGLTRAEFLDALHRARVPACQVTIDELREELDSWQPRTDESSTPRP
jgi:predicted HTH domain antitoxin